MYSELWNYGIAERIAKGSFNACVEGSREGERNRMLVQETFNGKNRNYFNFISTHYQLFETYFFLKVC